MVIRVTVLLQQYINTVKKITIFYIIHVLNHENIILLPKCITNYKQYNWNNMKKMII